MAIQREEVLQTLPKLAGERRVVFSTRTALAAAQGTADNFCFDLTYKEHLLTSTVNQSGLVLHVKCRTAPEDAPSFIALVHKHIAQTESKPGCNGYSFAIDVDDSSLFHIVEGWQDRAALDAHNASPEFQATLIEMASSVRILSRETDVYVVSAHDRVAPMDLLA